MDFEVYQARGTSACRRALIGDLWSATSYRGRGRYLAVWLPISVLNDLEGNSSHIAFKAVILLTRSSERAYAERNAGPTGTHEARRRFKGHAAAALEVTLT